MNRLRPDLRRPDLIDAGLVLAALLLHAGGAFLIDMMPPNRPFEVLLIGLPALVLLVALAAVLVRGERRPLQAACVLQWLLVLFALPAKLAANRRGCGPGAAGVGRKPAKIAWWEA